MGIWVHCPVHVGSRLLGTGDSFGKVSRSLLDGHVNGLIYHLLIALQNSADYAIVGRLESLRGNFIYVPLRIAQGAFERVPLVVFGQSRLQKAANVLWLYRQTLMTGKYFFLTKKMMQPVTLHQKMPSRHALRNGIFLI